mmetsp:Transcript_49747/g.158889  ORF Transcript_49747/g.158889 Transcript_49747/m.158889 type:complete len:241 (-) Transcript_49747:86-808(-)
MVRGPRAHALGGGHAAKGPTAERAAPAARRTAAAARWGTLGSDAVFNFATFRARAPLAPHTGPSMAPHVNLCSLADGSVLQPIYNPPSPNPRAARMGLHPPELHEVVAADGATKLYGALYRPDPAIYGPGPYKTVVSVYGGPHVQCVTKSWLLTVDMRAQFLRSRGFAVWKVDNRGSARRGLAFEGAIKWQMGGPDIGDQVAGVRALVALGVTDPDRVAIYGWSYGGYLSAMGLARYPVR